MNLYSVINFIYLVFCVNSGTACRFKVAGSLKKKFGSPKEAEKFYSTGTTGHNDCGTQTCLYTANPNVVVVGDSLSLEQVSVWLSSYCKRELDITVPEDFLSIATSAMVRLSQCQRSNVVYNLAKGISKMRTDGSDSCFPVLRMPMGLVEYLTNFYTSDNLNMVHACSIDWDLSLYMTCHCMQVPPCPTDYRQ